MFEAISMEFLIASLSSALLMGQIVRARELPGPRVSARSLLYLLFLTSALFRRDAQKLLLSFPEEADKQQRQ